MKPENGIQEIIAKLIPDTFYKVKLTKNSKWIKAYYEGDNLWSYSEKISKQCSVDKNCTTKWFYEIEDKTSQALQ